MEVDAVAHEVGVAGLPAVLGASTAIETKSSESFGGLKLATLAFLAAIHHGESVFHFVRRWMEIIAHLQCAN